MKKSEVQVGGVYSAKVSGRSVDVQIESENPRGGWEATNLATGKKVRIKTAQRLRRAVEVDEAAEHDRTAPEAAVSETPAANAKAKKTRKAKQAAADSSEKKVSCLDAAARVLAEAGEPLNAKQMIDAMAAKGYWTSPGGKTPHATLYSAIIREIAVKGAEARFQKTERGKFATQNA